ncbi:hypothetical protein KY495_18560 [Massilia sp. PAMC28688]|uniref:hypothetical protein n=1 Tax=Massilia sp. PAMC28688 TaxID=2861283 RepID=UPI001C62764B|nr:hypothetical protein [Massilia sp. PAMC28688]QYF92716.1 hypothetical protein KY495_18560 [Massilia sp. PAMC28688]
MAMLMGLALSLHAPARAVSVSEAADRMVAHYTLVSSTSAPDARWVYTKARLKVRRLDAQHLVLYFSCQWASWPGDACFDWWVVRQHASGLYLQDLNTGGMGVRFDPTSRTLTMTMEGAGKDVRTDVFRPGPSPAPDAVLERRMKRAENSFNATVAEPAFGKPARWDFTRQRVYPPAQ